MEKLDIRPVKNKTDHAWAMEQIDALMLKDELQEDEVRRLEVLAILVEKYECEHFPVQLPTPVEAIEFRIDQLGINRSQLADIIGFPRSRVSEVLDINPQELKSAILKDQEETLNNYLKINAKMGGAEVTSLRTNNPSDNMTSPASFSSESFKMSSNS
jgi:HTH-type transcriptional regulator/antitoxin HigA